MHHGMAKNHKLWFGWVPVIARHYRVIRFDMRGMGQSDVPEPGYPWSVDNFARDLAEFVDKLGLEKFHLIGETVGGSISMRYATMHQDRLLSLTACTSPTSFNDAHHAESAVQIENDGIGAWVESSIGRRLDPQIVDSRLYSLVRRANESHDAPRGSRFSGSSRGVTCARCSKKSKPRCSSLPPPPSAKKCWGTSVGLPTSFLTGARWYFLAFRASYSTSCPCRAPASGWTSPAVSDNAPDPWQTGPMPDPATWWVERRQGEGAGSVRRLFAAYANSAPGRTSSFSTA